jgi:DNA-binding HxlR family transcriptional regulator
MAIPHWTWPETQPSAASELADATAAFDVLSDRTRATILDALYDADEPLAHRELQDATGVEDNGRLNYHLRQLDGLLDKRETGYVLSDRGQRLVAGLVTTDALST